MNAISNEIYAWGKSDIGKKRKRNEDNFLLANDLNLYVVADGMGGHKGGATASKLAVSTVEDIVRGNKGLLSSNQKYNGSIEQSPIAKLLSDALRCACKSVHEKSLMDANLTGMGTTTTALLFHNEFAFVAHVGDSRAYILRNEKFVQLSDDHSLVNDQMKAGMISPEEARTSKMRNIITRSIGYETDVDVDITALEIFPNDTFLLCSDGLNSLVADEEIKNVILDNKLNSAPENLIDLANQRGGDDNTTVVLAYSTNINSNPDNLEVQRKISDQESNLTTY